MQPFSPFSSGAYGLWPLVILDVGIFVVFALSFARPTRARDWRSFGAFTAFVVALFGEMYGFPLTIYLLSGWLESHYPGVNLYSHDNGHLWDLLLGWHFDPHLAPTHLLSYGVVGTGFLLVGKAWPVLYRAQRTSTLAVSGLYARMRHPQYAGLVLILLGLLLEWPTLPTILMFPLLVVMYVRLARREEREARAAFGEAYEVYARRTPAIVPKLRASLG